MPSELGELVLHVRVNDPHALLDRTRELGEALGRLGKLIFADETAPEELDACQKALEAFANAVKACLHAQPEPRVIGL